MAHLGEAGRVLPQRVAGPVHAFRDVSVPPAVPQAGVSPELTAQLIEACTAARRLRLVYRMGKAADLAMEVDPWAVVLRHSRWYLLSWSHTKQARRVLRVDRIIAAEALPDTFTPPHELDALRTLEEHLSQGWTHEVDVLIDATVEQASRWLPRSLGHLEAEGEDRTRLRATTDEPAWYARQLAAIPAPFRVIGSAELQHATAALGQRLMQAAGTG